VRVVVLTGGDPTAAYMVERLRATRPLERVIQVEWTRAVKQRPPRQQPLWRRVPRGIDRRLQDRYRAWRVAGLLKSVATELFGRPEFDVAADEMIEAHNVNSDAFAERLAALAPDIMIVNGAPLLERRIYAVPRLGTLNVHFGLSPWYRGSFAQFWAVYHGDLDHLGATLHFIDDGVDTGPVVGYAFPERGPRDSEATIMARSAIGITEVIEKALERAASGGALPGARGPWHTMSEVSPDALGSLEKNSDGSAAPERNYKKRQRRFRHDLALWLDQLRRSSVALPARQLLFF
jgi:folate-dependent phosphoribosylglycinamide formyltransferase PurN